MGSLLVIGDIHLMHQTQSPIAGGNPRDPATTPFHVRGGWAPSAAKPSLVWQGGGVFSLAARPLLEVYDRIEETIPFEVIGNDTNDAAQALSQLKLAISGATTTTPAIWRHKPEGAVADAYAEVYGGYVVERGDGDDLGAGQGWPTIESELIVVRSPFFGAEELVTLLDAEAITNGPGTQVFSLGDVFGDLAREGQPLVVTLAKPATQDAAGVVLATVAQAENISVADTLAAVTSTTGTTFDASSTVDVAALRRLNGVEVHLLARLTSLTNPEDAEVRAEIQTSGGAVLWRGEWTRLGADTTAQLVDLGGAPLSAARLPIPSTTALTVRVQVSLRSVDGTAITATLEYIDLLLAYDFCVIESEGLDTGEHLIAYGAQNLSGGGWQPMSEEQAAILNSSDVQTATAKIRGQLARAFQGASLYVAWYSAGYAHTKTDTSTLTVEMAPLWRTLRGLS